MCGPIAPLFYHKKEVMGLDISVIVRYCKLKVKNKLKSSVKVVCHKNKKNSHNQIISVI